MEVCRPKTLAYVGWTQKRGKTSIRGLIPYWLMHGEAEKRDRDQVTGTEKRAKCSF